MGCTSCTSCASTPWSSCSNRGPASSRRAWPPTSCRSPFPWPWPTSCTDWWNSRSSTWAGGGRRSGRPGSPGSNAWGPRRRPDGSCHLALLSCEPRAGIHWQASHPRRRSVSPSSDRLSVRQLLDMRPGSAVGQRLVRGSVWVLAGRGFGVVVVLATNALLTRLLSPDQVGAYFVVLSLVMFCALLAQMGAERTAVRLVAESLGTGRPGRARAAIVSVAGIVGGGALVVAILLVAGP